MPFMFEVGNTYLTQKGDEVTILGRTLTDGYECLECSDGKYRYDRSDSSEDAGRCTGTAHDYSCPHNLMRSDRPYTPKVWSGDLMQWALDFEAKLSNEGFPDECKAVQEMIKLQRRNRPVCHGMDDCSTQMLSVCSWRTDCGE